MRYAKRGAVQGLREAPKRGWDVQADIEQGLSAAHCAGVGREEAWEQV